MRLPLDDSSQNLILVVDDDPLICEFLADGLAAFGYLACTAGSAKEALEIVKRETIGLVLTDIAMPELDGFELLRRIKAYDEDIDVIMVTGATDAETSIRAIRQGASDYVTKPLNLDEVQIVIRRTLHERRLVLENRAHQERLEDLVEIRTKEVTRLCHELTDSYESTLHALMTALDFRETQRKRLSKSGVSNRRSMQIGRSRVSMV